MNDHIKYLTQLAGRSALSFLKINIIGQALILGIAIISLSVLLYQSYGVANGTDPVPAGVIGKIGYLFSSRPIASCLVLLSAIGAPILLFSMGNKYILTKAINRVVTDKGEDILFPIISRAISKIKSKQPELLQKGADKAKLKPQLVQEMKESDENKWTKKITIYALNKVDLNDVDFKDENLSFSDIIQKKIVDSLKNVSEPSRSFFWVIAGVQVGVLGLVVSKIV